MAAPKGNRFWEARSSHGRNPKFSSPDDLWTACTEYFEWVEEHPLIEMRPFAYQGVVTQEEIPKMRAMTIYGLCTFLDIGDTTWHRYKDNEDFRDVTTRVERIIYDQKFSGAAAELLNANIIARDLGLRDLSSKEVTGKDGGAMEHKVSVVDQKMVDESVQKFGDIY